MNTHDDVYDSGDDGMQYVLVSTRGRVLYRDPAARTGWEYYDALEEAQALRSGGRGRYQVVPIDEI